MIATEVPTAHAAAQSSIDQLRDAHVAAMNAGDAAAFVACFAEDAVQMPPNFATNVGRAAIQGWIGGFFSAFRVQFSITPAELHIAGDWAFESGMYQLTMTQKTGGAPMHDSGKHITIYQRQSDSSWKTARDIWNTNNPPPARP